MAEFNDMKKSQHNRPHQLVKYLSKKHNITVLSINDWWKEGQEEIGGYIVHCPALKGCWSQGDTVEEALQNIKEAIAGYLKTLNERAILDVKIQSKVQIREVAVA